jgi:hypothetical protein
VPNPNADMIPDNRSTSRFADGADAAAAITAGFIGAAPAATATRFVAAETAGAERASAEPALALPVFDPVLAVASAETGPALPLLAAGLVPAEAGAALLAPVVSSPARAAIEVVLSVLTAELVLSAERVLVRCPTFAPPPASEPADALRLTVGPLVEERRVFFDGALAEEMSLADEGCSLLEEDLVEGALSAWATPDPPASAAPTPRVSAPTPSQVDNS